MKQSEVEIQSNRRATDTWNPREQIRSTSISFESCWAVKRRRRKISGVSPTFPNFAPFNPGFVPLPLFARRCTSSGAERRRSTKYRTLMSHKSKSSPFHFCVLERHNLGMEHRRQPLCCLRATEPGQRFCGFCYGTRLCRIIRPWRASDDRYGCRLL